MASSAPTSPVNKRPGSPNDETSSPKQRRLDIVQASQDPSAADDIEALLLCDEVMAPGPPPPDFVIHVGDGEADDVAAKAVLARKAQENKIPFGSVLMLKTEHQPHGEFATVGLSKIAEDQRLFGPSGAAAKVHWLQAGGQQHGLEQAEQTWTRLGFPLPTDCGAWTRMLEIIVTGPLWGFGTMLEHWNKMFYTRAGMRLVVKVSYYGAAYNNENGLTEELAALYNKKLVDEIEVFSRTQTVGPANDASYRNLACLDPVWKSDNAAFSMAKFMQYFLFGQTNAHKIFQEKNAPKDSPADLELWNRARAALIAHVGEAQGLSAYQLRKQFFEMPGWSDVFTRLVPAKYRAMLGVCDTKTYKAGDPLQTIAAPLLADQWVVLRNHIDPHFVRRVDGYIVKTGDFVNVVPGVPVDGAMCGHTWVLVNPESAETKAAVLAAFKKVYADVASFMGDSHREWLFRG